MTNEFTFKKMKPSDFVVALSSDEGTKVGYPYRVVSIWRDENGGVGITVELPDGCGAGLNEGEYEPLTRAAPTVKPLEWVDGKISDTSVRETAECLLGTCEVLCWSSGSYGGTFVHGPDDTVVEFEGLQSLDEAKAVVQADYERRILSALA